jgi:hypothetical protein
MTAMKFAREIIEGTGGLESFIEHELPDYEDSDRVVAAHWTLKCLANPDCEGSEEAIQAILAARQQRLTSKIEAQLPQTSHQKGIQ